MRQYKNLIQAIFLGGDFREDRTGTGTIGIFGHQMRFNLAEGFPLLTTKKLHTKSIIHELLLMLRGDTNIKYLNDNGVHIWDEWADSEGDLGPVYGKQWRSWVDTNITPDCVTGRWIDQIGLVVDGLRTNPFSRRHIVSAWNVSDIDTMHLPPCHMMMQFYVSGDGKRLSCQLYQRSADVFLGVPFNIASYALLTHIIAHAVGLKVGEFIHTLGDAHIYNNHIEQCATILRRDPRPLPKFGFVNGAEDLKYQGMRFIEMLKYEDFDISGYDPHPAIKGEVSV